MRFPSREVLACILERTQDPTPWLKLPPMGAEEAWALTEFLDEVQEAIWMDHGLEISDYLDARSSMDCYHAAEDPGQATIAPDDNQDGEF